MKMEKGIVQMISSVESAIRRKYLLVVSDVLVFWERRDLNWAFRVEKDRRLRTR